jgi:hypothetical protein
MREYLKDPLLWISILMAIFGSVQSATGLLTLFAEAYPIAFGIAMTAISAITGSLTALKIAIEKRGLNAQSGV